jgi:hypothetical protein
VSLSIETEVKILFNFIPREMIQPSAPLSPHLSSTKLDQAVVNMIVPNEFNQGTTNVKIQQIKEIV